MTAKNTIFDESTDSNKDLVTSTSATYQESSGEVSTKITETSMANTASKIAETSSETSSAQSETFSTALIVRHGGKHIVLIKLVRVQRS